MTKTENLNLPQWESTDAFRRSDFNEAFSALDSGYASVLTAAESAEAMASEALDGAAAEEKNFDRFCRAAYNRWQLLASQAEMPWQLGAFAQRFGEADSVTFSGTVLQRDDHIWLGNNTQLLTLASMRSTLSQSASLSESNNDYYLEFTPPYSGRISKLTLTGYYSATATNTGNCTVTLTNQTTGRVEQTVTASFGSMSGNGSGSYSIVLDLVIHANQKYRLGVSMLSVDNITFSLHADLTGSCLSVSGYRLGSATTTWIFDELEDSSGGLVLVRYVPWGTGATVGLIWDDCTLAPATTRTRTDSQGNDYCEAEFRRNETVPADSTLTLQLTCPADTELEVYNWGAVLL